MKGNLGGAKGVKKEELYLIADHARSLVFSIGDSVTPSNEGRGYVIRKLIRRSYIRSGSNKPFLYKLVLPVVNLMKEVYPELEEKRENISSVIFKEESRFQETLSSVRPIFEEMVSVSEKKLEGAQIFKLVDTYGFPFEMIQEEAEQKGITLDTKSFEEFMEKRRDESRKGSNLASDFIFKPDLFASAPLPEISDKMPLASSIVFILKDSVNVDSLAEGDTAEIIVSPQSSEFYSECGGQVGDKGVIKSETGSMIIRNVYSAGEKKVFNVFVEKGSFAKGSEVVLTLDEKRKKDTAKNHTATHLLQAALRKVLGEHVKQSGSFVDDKRLRFDFSHTEKISERDLNEIEKIVNGWIDGGFPVAKEIKSLQTAKAEGALSFFGDKYGDVVRVVSVSVISKELCGGTHVDKTSDIELVKIISEASVASGVRRIEAVTSENARNWLKEKLGNLILENDARKKEFGALYKAEEEVPQFLNALLAARNFINGAVKIDTRVLSNYTDIIEPAFKKLGEYVISLKKEKIKMEENSAMEQVKEDVALLISRVANVKGSNMIAGILDNMDMNLLRKTSMSIAKKIEKSVIILGSIKDNKVFMLSSVDEVVSKNNNLSARDIINSAAGKIGGGGGGSATFAQAGGNIVNGLEDAVSAAKNFVIQNLK
ncbi:alanyl-tRNA synthetase [Candidatus Omnitrophus magneticus]|uniref:Alanine--tRNA ligase n=1 Tax=Candidatus Omnitrophus magneticus TaxID=1609969 RepID=A0A0F0CTM4_9BACT|nr:alanyl-tRNA synthetase [Candidatus Omnitrophus magneticus]